MDGYQKVSAGFMPAGPQLAATHGIETVAALRPVYPGGSNVFASVGHHVLPLARGQPRARNNRRFKVAANCCLRPDEPAIRSELSLTCS